MKTSVIVATVCLGLASAATLDGGQPLKLEVTPTMARAPGFVSVRVTIESSDQNRRLEVLAESADFSRSSTVDLDGSHAPHIAVFEYAKLPAGLYQVNAVLIGADGRRAEVTRVFNVVPAAGS